MLDAKGENAIEALRVEALLAMSAADETTARDALNQAADLAKDADGQPAPGLRQIEALRAEDSLKHGAIAQACGSARIAIERAQAEAVNADSSAWAGEAILLRAQCEQQQGQSDAMHSSARAALPQLEQNFGEQHPLAVRARALLNGASPASGG